MTPTTDGASDVHGRRRVFGDGYHIIDELLFERATILRRLPFAWKTITRWFLPFAGYQEAVDWADQLGPLCGTDAYERFADHLALDVQVRGLEQLPKSGRVLIVANHPTGIVDALAIQAAIDAVRRDVSYFSNRDMMRIVPRLSEFVIPIEWLRERRTPSSLRDTLEAATAAFKAERAVVIFPGGGMARASLRGLKELEWLPAAIKFARRYQCPVLPLHIRARNSLLYYFVDAIHPELRDLLRFREVMSKRHQRFGLTFGHLIPPELIAGTPEEAVAALQVHVEQDLSRGMTRPRAVV